MVRGANNPISASISGSLAISCRALTESSVADLDEGALSVHGGELGSGSGLEQNQPCESLLFLNRTLTARFRSAGGAGIGHGCGDGDKSDAFAGFSLLTRTRLPRSNYHESKTTIA
jgi:hypothetical protein